MKKSILAAVCLAILFFVSIVSATDKKLLELERQVIINLCQTNARLADDLNLMLDKESEELSVGVGFYKGYLFYDRFGNPIESIPTSAFFYMVEESARRAADIKFNELFDRLIRHNVMLETAKKSIESKQAVSRK